MKHFNHPQQAPWRRLALCVAALGLTLSAFADNVTVSYISRSWDATNKVVKNSTVTATDAIPVTSSTTTLGTEGSTTTYVVNSDVTISSRITVNGTVNLILADGYTLTASRGINVQESNGSFNIFAQSKGSGALIAKSEDWDAAIGGNNSQTGGNISIYGGNISATGDASGIGGGYNCAGKNITIFGGVIKAQGGSNGAGIGGGAINPGENITIYDGEITATGGESGAGIGGGFNETGKNIAIYGGKVTATGGKQAAGIGGGYLGTGDNISIHGGIVIATGNGSKAQAIGSGEYANGENIDIYYYYGMRASSGSNIYEYTDQRNAFSQNTLKIEPCTDHNLVRTWDATADNELHLQSSCTYCGISNDYSCTLDELKKGKITITATGTPAQPTVTINVTPDANYILGNISYTANSAKSFVTADSLGAYVFNMPMANTVVNASFVPDLSYYKAYVNVTNNGTTNKVEATAKYLDIDNHIISIGDGTGVAIDKTTAGDLEVPETVTIDGIPFTVSEIGINAFNACASLTSASIPASVTALRTNAFCDASGLTKVTFGANSRLKTMEQGAFARNYKLAAINMPDSVETIGPSCFASDTALHIAINLPEIESIGQSAFQSSGITSVSLGDSLKAMGNQTFFQCASLESVSFSKNCALESLLWRTFADDTKLKSVTLPGNLKEIGQTCFRNCAFTSLELPSTLTTLVAYGFQACKNLLSLDFSGTQLSAIGNKAFEGSTNLRYVDLRNTKVNVTAVNRGRNEFNGIGSQVIIYLPAGNTVTGDNIVNTSEDGTLSAASITVNGTTYNTDKVKKGAATWALNKFYGTQVFGQTIDTQGAPVPSTDASSFVYKADFRYNGIVRATKYVNTGRQVILPSDAEFGATCFGHMSDENMSAIQKDIVVEVTLAAASTEEDVVLNDDNITDKDIVKIVPQNGGSSITVTFDDASTATASTASVGLAYVATLGSTTKTTNDNAKQLSIFGGRAVMAMVDRTLYTGQWITLSLPFSLSAEQITDIFGEGTRLAVFDKQSSTTELNFNTTDSIEAGVPYLIWPANNTNGIFAKDVVIRNITTGAIDNATNWGFHANVGSAFTHNGSDDVKYIALGNELKTLITGGTIAPMRAYLTYAAPAGAKVVRFTIDGTTTGIANIQADGEVTISHKGVYSLSGQYLGESTDSLPKGVYIVNGKKIIKK